MSTRTEPARLTKSSSKRADGRSKRPKPPPGICAVKARARARAPVLISPQICTRRKVADLQSSMRGVEAQIARTHADFDALSGEVSSKGESSAITSVGGAGSATALSEKIRRV